MYERRRDLPRVGIAALAAEAYLPFTGRDRGDLRLARGLVLALVSAVRAELGVLRPARRGGDAAAAVAAAAAAIAAPALFGNRRWLVGFCVGIGGWVLYVVALALAPLSLVQAVSAGGIGLLALLAALAGVRLAQASASRVATSSPGSSSSPSRSRGPCPRLAAREPRSTAAIWMLASVALAAVCRRPGRAVLAARRGLGIGGRRSLRGG